MPINLGDGTGVASIRRGDGTEIVEVRKGDGTVVWTAETLPEPSTLVNRLPLDEGSGTSVSDSIGTADGTLATDGTWTSDSAFYGGTAPAFDGDHASWQPRATTPITWMFRVRVENTGGSPVVWGYDTYPRVRFSNSEWQLADQNATNTITVADSGFTSDDTRIVACRLNSNDMDLDVWDAALSKIGDANTPLPATGFDGSTTYFGDSHAGTGNLVGEMDLIDIHDTRLSDSELDTTVQNVYSV